MNILRASYSEINLSYEISTNSNSLFKTPAKHHYSSIKLKTRADSSVDSIQMLNAWRKQKINNSENKFPQLNYEKNVISRTGLEASQKCLSANYLKDITDPAVSRLMSKDCRYPLLKSSSESDCQLIMEHRRQQCSEISMEDSSIDKSYKTTHLKRGVNPEELASKQYSVGSCSVERTKINLQLGELKTLDIRECGTQTEESSFFVIDKSKLTKLNCSTQTYLQRSNRFTQTLNSLLIEVNYTVNQVNLDSIESVPNKEHTAKDFLRHGEQLKPEKVKKRVIFHDVDTKIQTLTPMNNESFCSTVNESCEETEISKRITLENTQYCNVASKSNCPLICRNSNVVLMNGLSQNLGKNTILSKNNQNLRVEEFNKQNNIPKENKDTSSGRMCPSKPVNNSPLKKEDNLKGNPSPHRITILKREKDSADETKRSDVDVLPATDIAKQVLPVNMEATHVKDFPKLIEHNEVKFDMETEVGRQVCVNELSEIFKISISDVLPRYRSVNNELIHTSVEIAQSIGVKPAFEKMALYSKPLESTEEVIIFYSGCSDDLHYVTTDIWDRTVKLYSHDIITLSQVENIGNEKLNTSKIIEIWNVGFLKIWYYTFADNHYKLKVIEENKGQQHFENHKYILTNMTTEGLPLYKYSINYFIEKAKQLMETMNN